MSSIPTSPARRLEAARAKYPNINPAEILVWQEFLRLHEGEYDVLPQSWLAFRSKQPGKVPQPGDVFDYNVRIGTGRDPGPSFTDAVRQMAIMATQFRLDAVGFQGGVPVIFEIKRDAGPPQIGQLLSYDAIWRAQKLTPGDPKMVLVAADFKENALYLLQESNIALVTVPVDFRNLSPYAPTPLKP